MNNYFGNESKLSSEIIREYEPDLKYKFVRQKLISLALGFLKEDKTFEETRELIIQHLKMDGLIR